MLSKEAYIFTELLGRDTPQVKALLAAAAANPDMEGVVEQMLRSMMGQRGWNPDDPPRFALPHDLAKSDYPVGRAMAGNVAGAEVGPSEQDLSSHLGVFGMTATGKTTLVKLVIILFVLATKAVGRVRRFLILDLHGEYRDLISVLPAGAVIWLSADEIGLNPLEVPRGQDGQRVMAPDQWMNHLREWLRLFWLNEPSCNLFCEVLHEEYERRGVLAGGEDYPSISDMIEVLRALSVPTNSDRSRARDKLLDRLTSLRAQLPGLDVQRSRDFNKLLDQSVILDLVNVKDIGLPVLFSLLMTLLRETHRSVQPGLINLALVMEEAHEYMGGQMDRRTSDLKEGKPSSVLRDLRKTGTVGVVVTQLPADLAPSILGNIGTIFSLRLGERRCVHQAASALNLEPWREEEIAKLPNRHAIARFSRHGEPVYLAIADLAATRLAGARAVTRDEARDQCRAALEANPYVKRAEVPPPAQQGSGGPTAAGRDAADPTAGGLQPRERHVFARIAERPWETIEDRMDALRLDREAEGSARSALEARGLIGFAGKLGAKNRLFELTARGRELAREMGVPMARAGKGSVVHEAIVHYTEMALGRLSAAFRFRRSGVSATTGGVQPDSLLILPGGGRIPLQGCCKNAPAYEADAILKLHALTRLGPGDADRADLVLAVAVNRRHKAALERALERANGGRLPDRVVLLDFDTIMAPDFDGAEVLERPL